MTVNEALWESGKSDDFDKAVKSKDVNEVKNILKDIGLSDSSILPILKSLELG